MRDALNTARTRRYAIGQILTGKVVRTADDIAAVAAFVAASSLTAITGATFGLFDTPTADDSCSITSGAATLTSPNNPWAAGDVGKAIDVQGAGAAGATLRSRIKAFGSAGSVTLWDNAGTTVAATSTSAGGLAIWGNDLTQTRTLPVRPNEAGTSELSVAAESTIPTGVPIVRTLAAMFADLGLNVKNFGALGDNATDDTAAINLAIATAVATAGHPHVYFPVGRYVVTAPLLNAGGIRLLGHGGEGSSEQCGVTLVVKHNGNAINFDGTTGTDFECVGGGVENMEILKFTGFSGGDAIYVNGVSDNRRAGEMIFRNVLVAAISTGLWARGLHIDGSALVTAGSIGVRSVMLEKVRVACCTTDNEYIRLNQVTHVYGHGVQIDTATGTGVVGGTILGTSENVCLGVVINGNLTIDAAATCVGLRISGRVSALIINSTTSSGSVSVYSVSAPITKSRNVKIQCNSVAYFEAEYNGTAANATGDGTVYTLLPATNEIDNDGGYDPVTGTFTCKQAGLYQFSANVVINGVAAAHTLAELAFVATGKTKGTRWNPFADSVGGISYKGYTALFRLAYGDTVSVTVKVSNGTKVVGITSDTSICATIFHGKYLAS